jgi:pimeloyl-ACP methyl ester carboxylesterase
MTTSSTHVAAFAERGMAISAGPVTLFGDLTIPESASGLGLFAHGSGSSRHSSRNRFVAHELQRAGLATLLFDLLTPDEEQIDLRTRHLRFDIPLLALRLEAVTQWAEKMPMTRMLRPAYFGASTGGGAALVAAAQLGSKVAAVVSRGGRPDLAGPALPLVVAPTLLIVGGDDVAVIGLNRQALERMRCERRLVLVPGATHLFEEPGTLEEAARLAAAWFTLHLEGANA